MKYNIPARTLRDWMKRLNIKSVFTHHSQKDGRSLSADSSESNSANNIEGEDPLSLPSSLTSQDEKMTELDSENVSIFVIPRFARLTLRYLKPVSGNRRNVKRDFSIVK